MLKTKLSRMFLGRFVPLRIYGYMMLACVATVWLELMGQQMLAAKGQENPATTGLWICVVFALWFSYFHTNLAVSLGVHPRKAHVGAGLYLLVVVLVVVAIDLAFRKLFCQPVLGLKYILPFSLEDVEWKLERMDNTWNAGAASVWLVLIVTGIGINQTWNIRWKNRGKRR